MIRCVCSSSKIDEFDDYYKCSDCRSVIVKKKDNINVDYDESYASRGFNVGNLLSLIQSYGEYSYFRKVFKNKSCLDYGCGSGMFYEFYKKRGFDIDGYDLNYRNLSELLIKKYDVILCFHVVEHVDDPVVFLRNMTNMLNKGGVLILRTPRADSFEFFLAKENWFHFDSKYHKFIFSRQLLKSTLGDLGFKNIKDDMFFDYMQTLGYSLFPKSKLKLILGIICIPISFVLRFFDISPNINIYSIKSS